MQMNEGDAFCISVVLFKVYNVTSDVFDLLVWQLWPLYAFQ